MKEEKRQLFEYKINKLAETDVIKKLEPYFIKYCKALKEIWQLPIKDDKGNYIKDNIREYRILEKYGLGEVNRYFGFKIDDYYHFKWNEELVELDKQVKMFTKI